ncbi:hypothetical protein ATHL_01150 [Anaerolinea thermolimosa]|nr:DUF3048 domain-containing protein [Anaerolinea thermolimosa]GAP06298.1 hypothetical protein ATHL_01150 [Anaerolinea thermolimosa]
MTAFENRESRRFPHRFLSWVVVGLMALGFTGCQTTPPQPAVWSPRDPNLQAEAVTTELPTPQANQEPLPSPTPMPLVELPELPPNINPLTGLPVEDLSRLERRPVMVKISNYPRAGRPHAGLSFADLVFEYYIGYGFNRFMAVFLGQDAEMAGPVRSGRLVDAQLAEMYQGILFYGNADDSTDEEILAELGPRALAEKDVPSPPKYRIQAEIPETTLFVNTRELSDYYTSLGKGSNDRRDLRGMIFSDEIHPVNEPAEFLAVQFSRQARGEWRYDRETGLYRRWIETGANSDSPTIPMEPLVDRINNRPIAMANVILVFATYTELAPTKHNIALFDQNAGKRAVFFRDGVRIEGTWRTVSNGRPIQFFNSWGLPMHLKPGPSWIVLVGETSTLTSPAPGQWELRFDIP